MRRCKVLKELSLLQDDLSQLNRLDGTADSWHAIAAIAAASGSEWLPFLQCELRRRSSYQLLLLSHSGSNDLLNIC
jgi:hypothetical protein